MSAIEGKKAYKSPIHKLLSFFRRSRDGWKKKCRAAKAMAKDLKNSMGKLRQSRDRWKVLARDYKQRLKALEGEGAEKKRTPENRSRRPRQNQQVPSRGN